MKEDKLTTRMARDEPGRWDVMLHLTGALVAGSPRRMLYC
jgi:hypothetical protein